MIAYFGEVVQSYISSPCVVDRNAHEFSPCFRLRFGCWEILCAFIMNSWRGIWELIMSSYSGRCLKICLVAEQLLFFGQPKKLAIKPTEPRGHGPQGPRANIIMCFVLLRLMMPPACALFSCRYHFSLEKALVLNEPHFFLSSHTIDSQIH